MKARNPLNERISARANAFVEMAARELPESAAGSDHLYKYRLVLAIDQLCMKRHDNEPGNGDHRHIRNRGYGY